MEIERIFKEGKFYSFELNRTTVDDVVKNLGSYTDSEKSKYLLEYYWDNISMIFDRSEGTLKKIKIEFDDGVKYETNDINKTIFTKKMPLESILLFLNHEQINYQISNSELDFDYAFIHLNNNVRLTYYLEWKELLDISIVDTNW